MTINSSLDTKTGSKNLTVSARGHAAEQLAQILKLAGMESSSPEPMEVEVEMDEEQEYANEPAPEVQSTDVINAQGNDLNRQKTQHKHGYRNGDNPMAMAESAAIAAIEKRLMEELDSIKIVATEGWEDMMKDVAKTTKDTTTTGKFDKKKVSTGTVYTKKHGPADKAEPVAKVAKKK
jgi:hypothetical protein